MTYPQVVPNLNEFLSSAKQQQQKEDILKNVVTRQLTETGPD